MSEPKFTLGKWWVEYDRGYYIKADGVKIERIIDPKKDKNKFHSTSNTDTIARHDNGNLIAAAPDMLEFIEWIRSIEGQCAILKGKKYLPQILEKADEILKKARGEE